MRGLLPDFRWIDWRKIIDPYRKCAGAQKALESEPYGQLSHNVLTALRYIGVRLEKTVVRDPANEDNVVSNDLSMAEKTAIAKAARNVTYDENWKKILW